MNAKTNQFIFFRVEAKGTKVATTRAAEAARCAGFCAHISDPKPPEWLSGSQEEIARDLHDYMRESVQLQTKGGSLAKRKQRHDARCCTNTVASYPIRCADLFANGEHAMPTFRIWLDALKEFLRKTFPAKASGIAMHLDEEYPHVHVFYIGDPKKLHPGIRAEIIDGVRPTDAKLRSKLHRSALRKLLDDFHAQVGLDYGHSRKGKSRVNPRIASRTVFLASKLLVDLRAQAIQSQAELALVEQLERIVIGGPRSLLGFEAKVDNAEIQGQAFHDAAVANTERPSDRQRQ